MGSSSLSDMLFRTILLGWFLGCSSVVAVDLYADTGVEMVGVPRNPRALEGQRHSFRRENNPFQQHDPMDRYSFNDGHPHEFASFANEHLIEPVETGHPAVESKVADDVLDPFYSELDALDFDKNAHLGEHDKHQKYAQNDFHRLHKAPLKQSKKRAYRKRKKSAYGRGKQSIDHAWRRNPQQFETEDPTYYHLDDEVDENPKIEREESNNQSRLDNIGQKIPKSITNMIKKSGRKVLDSVLRQQSPFRTKQANDDASSNQGMFRTIMTSMSKAFSPDHVSLHIIANWVNVLAISVIWVGLGSMFASTVATGREYNPPFWDEFLPDKEEVALAFREIAEVAETWGHDEL